MAIKTNLNIAPYFDDYDISKKYYRVLFKPGRAVQARELTQLQTTLQNQIEQFGENIYKEGSIIKGCTFTEIRNLKYVKVVDGIRPEDYIETTIVQDDGTIDEYYYEIEDILGLKALIVQGTSGFQSRSPDLNTFFIVYLNSAGATPSEEKKSYTANDALSIREYILRTQEIDGQKVETTIDNGIVASTSVAGFSDPVGDSFGLNASEGVIFQRGHFLFVDDQTIVVKKYLSDETVEFELEPNNISVGYAVDESIISSQQDTSLLDNANGSPNENAPGADRLLMVPRLVARATVEAEADSEFFILRRYENGDAVETRDVSQFNSIAKELAKRTYEASGDFSQKQFKFQIAKRADNEMFVEMSEGVMYAKGYRISNDTKRFFRVPNVTTTQVINSQPVNFNYGGFVQIVGDIGNVAIRTFQNVSILDSDTDVIGSGIVKNITSERVYIFAIRMAPGKDFSEAVYIGSPTGRTIEILPKLINSSESRLVFDFNRPFVKDITGMRLPIRKSVETDTNGSGVIVISPAEGEFFDQNSLKDLLVVSRDGLSETISIVSKTILENGNLYILTGKPSHDVTVYYNATQNTITPKVKQSTDIFIKTTYDSATRIYTLGVPDAIRILEIKDAQGRDVTSSFKLFNNQKDDFYDHSYIERVAGTSDPANGTTLTIQVRVFRTNTAAGVNLFTIDSYPNTDLSEIPYFSASDGKVFDLKSSIDFRPYRIPIASYSTTALGATLLATRTVELPNYSTEILASGPSYIVPSIDTSGSIDIEYYSSRVDYIIASSYGRFSYVTGEEAGASRGKIDANDNSIIAEVLVPGRPLLTNEEAFRLNRLNESISLTSKTVTGYTMKDIDDMSKKLERLVYYVTLSALETSTSNLLIQDANGNNRFKNGIIVDPFKDLSIADVGDATFNASVDASETALKPSVKQFPLDLKIKSSNGTTAFGPVTTLASDRIIRVLKQQYATSFRSCTSNVYSFIGVGALTPNYEVAYDTVTNPAQIDLDLTQPFIDYTEALSEFVPLTRLDRSEFLKEWTETNTTSVKSGKRTRSTTTTQSFEEWNDIYRTLSVSSGELKEDFIGDFITDLQFRPYMRSREIQVEIYGLRPNTTHYFFFDSVPVNASVANGIFKGDLPTAQASSSPRVVRDGNFGTAVKTNANGELFAIFKIPENTFLVGERELVVTDIDNYDDIESASASFGKLKYNAYNFNVEKAGLTAATRFPDIDVIESTTPRTVAGRSVQTGSRSKCPLAQTFFIKEAMTRGADALYVNSIDLYFKRKSLTNGVTIQIREVENGYPAWEVVAFGKKHLRSSEVKVSDNASEKTTIVFDAPVRLDAEKEYAIVIQPDADDPDYLVFTTRPGGTDLTTGESVNADWGDGVLFTSTNNRAWTAYQDEDIKFDLYRYNFNVNSGTVELETMGHEFLEIGVPTANIKSGELVYALKGTLSASVAANTESTTVTGSLSDFNIGDYIYLQNAQQQKDIIKIVAVTNSTSIVIERPPVFGGSGIMARRVVAGIVTYFNPRKPNFLVLENSSARLDRKFENADTLIGSDSGATATLTSVQNIELSYIQAMINRVTDNDTNVKASVKAIDPLAPNSLPYTQEFEFASNKNFNERGCLIFSKSNDVNQDKNLKIVLTLGKVDIPTTTPVIDVETAQLFAYVYQITNNPDTTAKYISKKVELQEGFDAEDFRLYVTGYRPVGTNIRAYIKIKNSSDPVTLKNNPWIELDLTEGASLFSSTSNMSDYKEYVYEIPTTAKVDDVVTYTNDTGTYTNYRSFAIRLDLLSTNIANVPKIMDYRGVAFE